MATIIKPEKGVRHVPKHVGGWLPNNPKAILKYVEKIVDKVKQDPPPRSQVVRALENLINTNPEVYMLFNEMLDEVPLPYRDQDPWPIKDVPTLLDSLDLILSTAPYWTGPDDPQIGTPINALFLWPMATTAGFAVFLKTDVNEVLRDILNHWGDFLSSTDSRSTLNDQPEGWFSSQALETPHMKDFAINYDCKPEEPYYGFTSWDDFFTRKFNEHIRDVVSPGDDTVVTSAAECTPFAVQTSVQLLNKFWIKGQPYSLTHMMNNDFRARSFVGGTVFQAFLSADSYHCWHAPVTGTIVDTKVIPGAYYSEPVLYSFKPDEGDPTLDPGADELSQGYISSVAARCLIWIEADNPDIGLMCVIMIGMAEVSTVDITVPQGTHVVKGDLIGMFHFGGSTHCLVFGPQLNFDWSFPLDPMPAADQVKVKSRLATVSKK